MIKEGDIVKFTKMPAWVTDLPTESQEVFKECLGKEFSVKEIDQNNLNVLDVSKLIDSETRGFMNDIRLEDEFLEKIK